MTAKAGRLVRIYYKIIGRRSGITEPESGGKTSRAVEGRRPGREPDPPI